SARPAYINCAMRRCLAVPDASEPDQKGCFMDIPQRTSRRVFVRQAATGSAIAVLGGLYFFNDAMTRQARAETRADGCPRLPPRQRVIEQLKPMGGVPGNPDPSQLTFTVSGEVNKPLSIPFKELLALPTVELTVDVHCVTGWS